MQQYDSPMLYLIFQREGEELTLVSDIPDDDVEHVVPVIVELAEAA
jgi:hypothetical protein